MSKVKFDNKFSSGNTIFVCPCCHFEYTHQGTVKVYNRKEDEETYMVTTVKRESSRSSVQTPKQANPSTRRSGLTIEFWCEGCDNISLLEIWQHKGVTMVTTSTEEGEE